MDFGLLPWAFLAFGLFSAFQRTRPSKMAPWLQETTDAIGLLLACYAVLYSPLKERLGEDEMAIGDSLALGLAVIDCGLWMYHLITGRRRRTRGSP